MKKLNGMRIGLSPLERGIPVEFYINYAEKNNLKIVKIVYFAFGPWNYLKNIIGNRFTSIKVHIDFILSKLFSFNNHYERTKMYQKFAPCAVGIVFLKNG